MIQVAGFGFMVALLVLVLREQKPVFAFLLTLVACGMLALFVLGKLNAVLGMMQQLARQAGVQAEVLHILLKITGISYIAEFAAQLVRDAGQEALAGKIELAGKMTIVWMAIPIVQTIMETVVRLFPGNG